MNVSDFDYHLPESYIAQEPVEPRDSSRLMVLDRRTGAIEHLIFRDIQRLLNPGDVLVLNDTRVIPARLIGYKLRSGGRVEFLLLRQVDERRWRALVGGRGLQPGTEIGFDGSHVRAKILETSDSPERVVEFSHPVTETLAAIGQTPLPPYIHTHLSNPERYQTVYNRHSGSAAAPTAGLHFTPDLLTALRERGIVFAYCTLHIGLDTFQPIRVAEVEQHRIHSESASLKAEDAEIINQAKLRGNRIIAVGTTSARTLETAAILSAGGQPSNPNQVTEQCPWRAVVAFERDTDLFIYPGYRWRVVDGLVTNFHLPRSTLLMMVSSFASRESLLHAYEIAKAQGYRFYSFGDAMFIA